MCRESLGYKREEGLSFPSPRTISLKRQNVPMYNSPTSLAVLLHFASKESLSKSVAESFLEARVRGTRPPPTGMCREAEGLPVGLPYQHGAVYSRTVACSPWWSRTSCLLLRNPRPLTLLVLNKAVKIAHLHVSLKLEHLDSEHLSNQMAVFTWHKQIRS